MADGSRGRLTLSAVQVLVSDERGAVMFVDNDARDIYGKKYLDAPSDVIEARMRNLGARVLSAAREAYAAEWERAGGAPTRKQLVARLKSVVAEGTR